MSSESNFSYTTKINNDLLTVRGDTFDEFFKNAISLATVPAISHLVSVLDGSADTQPADPVAAAVNVVAAGLGAVPVATPPADPFGGSFAPVAPPATASAGDRTCSHGVMVKRTGQGAKGEWRAWFCPTPKGTEGQCQPQFANKKNPVEWNQF